MIANIPVREVPISTSAPSTVVSDPAGRVPAETTMNAMPTVVVRGVCGLAGGEEVFAPDNIERILHGEVRIQPLHESMQDKFLSKKVVRLHKDPQTGQGTFQAVEGREEVIRLAGVKAKFDLSATWC